MAWHWVPGLGAFGETENEGSFSLLLFELGKPDRSWVAAGQPGYQRFGLTVTPDRQELWLDDPANVIPGC
jgi:hypothetical protein